MNAALETPEVLSIGAVFGGSAEIDELWRPEVLRLMNSVRRHGSNPAKFLAVNVVFHIDGRLLPPVDFEGTRTGSLSRKQMLLLVQAAVPHEPVEQRMHVLLTLLHDAVTEAELLARRRKIADGLPDVRSVLVKVAMELTATAE